MSDLVIPRHSQLMAPADDPQEFIESSIWWHPLIFPTRTEVLEHTMLCNGNGYEWGEDGNIHSVFAHIDPRGAEDSIARLLRQADEEEMREAARSYKTPAEDSMAAWYRQQAAGEQATRDDYKRRARTYGPVRTTEQVPCSQERQARMIDSGTVAHYTLLGRMPENVTPAWAAVAAEARDLFAPILIEQATLW